MSKLGMSSIMLGRAAGQVEMGIKEAWPANFPGTQGRKQEGTGRG